MSDEFRITAVAPLLTSSVFTVERRTVEHDNHSYHRDVVSHPGAVAILAIDERGRIGVIRQYRATFDRYNLEIPAGTLDVPGEAPLEAAKRELAEEIGCDAQHWRALGTFMVSPGWTNQLMHIYEVTGLSLRDRAPAGPEESAAEVHWYEPDELRAIVSEAAMVDSTMTIALHLKFGRFFDQP